MTLNEEIIRLFVKNQLLISPSYDGEILNFKGEQYDTGEITAEYRSQYKVPQGTGELELAISFLTTNDTIGFETPQGYQTLERTLDGFRDKLPVKYRAKDFIDKMMESGMYEMAKAFVVNTKELPNGVYSSNLVIKNFSRELFKKALENTLGLEDSRFIFNRTKNTKNGNLLDLVPKNFDYLCKIKQPIASGCSLIRSLGFPYSDYRKFITYGFLVSTDSESNIYVVCEEYLYCCNDKKFLALLENPSQFDKWQYEFFRVYVLDELEPFRKLDWRLLR